MDTACLLDLRPVSFEFTTEESQDIFGTDDAWENAPARWGAKAPAPPSIDVNALRRALVRPPL